MSTHPPGVKVHEFTADLVVQRRQTLSDGVIGLDLVSPQGDALPDWAPGAHIDLMLPNELTRQYSLCGDPGEPDVWRIGVLLDPQSRGGSRYIHENLSEGTTVRVRGPRNHFQLVEAPNYRFIAGGIGITPLLTMLEAAQRAGNSWSLLYLGRAQRTMAFVDHLRGQYGERVTLWPEDEHGMIDIKSVLSEPAEDTLLYCCGPEGLLTAVEEASSGWPEGSLHIERFAAKTLSAEDLAGGLDQFEVVCQRSGVTVQIPPDLSILEALEDAGIPVLGSCYEGTCGTCETRVVQGVPDHRDSVLNNVEHTSGTVMLICVSRSRTERLVLDL